MYRHAKSAFALVVAFIPFVACVSAAQAQCQHTGTVACPVYVAPATTAVPSRPMDGSTAIPVTEASIMLFNGAVPPNGFLVQMQAGNACWINDNGPANGGGGFLITNGFTFVTPAAYRPMGPVSIACPGGSSVPIPIFARGW